MRSYLGAAIGSVRFGEHRQLRIEGGLRVDRGGELVRKDRERLVKPHRDREHQCDEVGDHLQRKRQECLSRTKQQWNGRGGHARAGGLHRGAEQSQEWQAAQSRGSSNPPKCISRSGFDVVFCARMCACLRESTRACAQGQAGCTPVLIHPRDTPRSTRPDEGACRPTDTTSVWGPDETCGVGRQLIRMHAQTMAARSRQPCNGCGLGTKNQAAVRARKEQAWGRVAEGGGSRARGMWMS